MVHNQSAEQFWKMAQNNSSGAIETMARLKDLEERGKKIHQEKVDKLPAAPVERAARTREIVNQEIAAVTTNLREARHKPGNEKAIKFYENRLKALSEELFGLAE